MIVIDEDRYMQALENALRRAKNRNKEKIEEIVQSDYAKGKIAKEVYQEANKRINDYFKNSMIARIKITKYDTIEQLESKMGVKIEGHKYKRIEGLEDEER